MKRATRSTLRQSCAFYSTYALSAKRWHRVNYSAGTPHGGAALSVKVKVNEEMEEFHTEGEVFLQVSSHLSERFRLAFTAGCFKGQLFNDLGFIGNAHVAQQILEGTYNYPPDVDPALLDYCLRRHLACTWLRAKRW